jgi:hypothetical protein
VDHVKISATKEKLDIAITTIWDELAGTSKTYFPPFLPITNYVQ